MRSLALWLYPQQLSRQGLPRVTLIDHMKSYLLKKRFDNEEDAENAAVEFVDFCKGRAWVLTDVGAELYGFTHRTFLEYFAASQIVRENTDPAKLFDYLVERLRTGGWELVAQLALQILNKAVEDGADDFLEILLTYVGQDVELRLKWKLMAFATQSLTYIVPRPAVLRSLAATVIDFVCSQPKIPDLNGDVAALVYLLFGAAPENLPLIAKYTFDELAARLVENEFDDWALSMAVYTDAYAVSAPSRTEYEISNNNRDFWKRQSELQSARFRSAAEAQKRRYSWVAVYLLERGLCSIAELLDWFGPAALYEDLPVERTSASRELALATRIVLSKVGITGNWLVPYGSATKLTQSQIDEIKDALLRLNTPWFSATEDMTIGAEVLALGLERVSYTGVVREARPQPGSLSALLFFAATLCDITDAVFYRILDRYSFETSRTQARLPAELVGQPQWDLLYSMLISRTMMIDENVRKTLSGSKGIVPISREVLSESGIDEATASVLYRWISDPKFRFIKGVRRGRFGRR